MIPANITLIAPTLLVLHALLVYVLPAIGISSWPITRTWGFGHIALFPNWILPAYIAATFATIPSLNRWIQVHTSTLLNHHWLRYTPLRVATVVVLLSGFWWQRQKYAILGDGYTWIDNVAAGNFEGMGGIHLLWAVYPRVLHGVMRALPLAPFETVQLSSCLFGFLFTFLAWHYSSSIATTQWGRLASFAMIMSSGVIQFYFGYGEAYPPVPVLILAFASVGIRALDGRAQYGLPLFVGLICLVWHPFMISLTPACAYLLWNATPRHQRLLTRLVFPAMLFATIASLYFRMQGSETFLPILPSSELPYAILTLAHLWERINAVTMTSPAIAIVMIVAIPALIRRAKERDATVWFLSSIAIPMVSVATFSNILLGALDWDIMSSMCFPLVLLVARAVQHIPHEATAKHIASVSVMFSLLNTAPWVIANHTDCSFKVMKIFMEDEPVAYFLTHESSVRQGVFAYRAGRSDVAIAALEDGRSRDPDSARIRFNLAAQYYVEGRYEEALDEASEALARDILYVLAYRKIIASLRKLGRNSELKQFGTDYLAHLAERGKKALSASDSKLAARIFETVIEMGAKAPEIYANLGAAYLQSGRHREAEKTLRKGLSLFPSWPKLLWSLALAQRAKGEDESVQATLTDLLLSNPDWEGEVFREFGSR